MGYRNTSDIPVPKSAQPLSAVRPTGITPRAFAVLKAVSSLIKRNGFSPSLEEIGYEVGLSAISTVHKHIFNLELRGLVLRNYNCARSVELTRSGKKLLARES